MALFDILLVLPLIYGLVRGLYRGLISEIASIVSLIGGLILAFYFSEDLYVKLSTLVQNPGIELRVISFIVVFVVVIIAINLLSRTITKAINMIALGAINHLLGGLFGLAKWFLVVLVLVYFLKGMQSESTVFQKDTLTESFVYQRFASYSEYIEVYIEQAIGPSDSTDYTTNPLP